MKPCYGCFSQLNDNVDICPFCGFSYSRYSVVKWTLRPGPILNNKYLLGKRLGEGGFGITYLAWDMNLQTKVAVKEYYPSSFVSRDITGNGGNYVDKTTTGDHGYDFDEGLKKFVLEASILSKFFNLPGIVTVKDFFYENGTAYIVMEYIDGVSLKDYLKGRGGKLSAEETVNLIRPVISSLSVVHNNKLLHRDISPDNIMIQKDGSVKLIDFGTARFFDSSDGEKSMTVMLKHGYAPIEQYSRNAIQSAYTDVYALCAVMYRMITGKAPIEATDRVRSDGLIPIKKISKKTPKVIAAAIERGLSVMPEDRQQSMAELERDLFLSNTEAVSGGMYNIAVRLLIAIMFFLIIAAGVGITYRINQNKIDDFRSRIRVAFGYDTDSADSKISKIRDLEDEEDSEDEEKRTDNEDINNEESEEIQNNNETTTNDIEDKDTRAQNNDDADVFSKESDSAKIDMTEEEKEKMAYSIMVVRDGVITGRESIKTGEILDNYSDFAGTWSGHIDPDTGEVFVYYTGQKNGEKYAIEFSVYSDDTFKVTAAGKNGEIISNYSEFFQEILLSEGL